MVQRAFVYVNTQIGKEDDVLKSLRLRTEIIEAYKVYGVYDIIAKIEVNNMSELDKSILKLRKIKYVRNTTTSVIT